MSEIIREIKLRGKLKVYVGPMYAGKTSTLLQKILWAQHQEKNILVLKPSKDNRYSEDSIITHNQLHYPCVNFDNFEEIDEKFDIKSENYDIVFLDEIQFIDLSTIKIVEKWLKNGVSLVATGLDQDSNGVPFDSTAYLMALSDKITKLTAICSVCGKEASKTYRDNPSEERIVVGSVGMYEARCLEHWS